MNAATIAQALSGHRNGAGYLVRCPVPSHGKGEGDKRPSLSIKDGATALLVRCFAGCCAHDVLDELRRRGLLAGTPRTAGRPGLAGVGLANRSDCPPPEPEPDHEALALWRAAVPIGETLAERYLREHRQIEIDPPPSLRFLPDATYPRTGHRFPAMVAAVARPDRKVVAVQVTYLGRNGRKAPVSAPRLTFGKLGGGAIRLAPTGATLGFAEGVETALSAMQLSGVPCWATLGGLRLGKIALPDCVREIHIFADDDAAGRLAAECAAGAYSRQTRKVLMRFPPDGCGDFNDALRMQVGRTAA